MSFLIATLSFFLAFQSFSQDLNIGLSHHGLQKIVTKSLMKTLGRGKRIDLQKDQVSVLIKNIVLKKPSKSKSNDFLLVYGHHVLKLDFDDPFQLGLVLENINIDIELGDVAVKLAPSLISEGHTYIPFKGSVFIKKFNGKVPSVSMNQETLTKKSIVYQSELLEKFERTQDLSQFTFSQKEDLVRIISLRKCIKDNLNGKKQFINIKSSNHLVKGAKLELDFKGQLRVEDRGLQSSLSFHSLSFEDNLSSKNFNDFIKIEFNKDSFHIFDTLAVTTNYKKKVINCYELEESHKGFKENLIGEVILPKVQNLLSEKVAQIVEEKAYPELVSKIQSKEIDFKNSFRIFLSKEKIKSPKITKIIGISFNDFALKYRLEGIRTYKKWSELFLGGQIFVDSERVDCDCYVTDSCEYFFEQTKIDKFNSDTHVAINGKLLTSIVNQFDDFILQKITKEVALLNSGSGNPLLTLENHNLLIVPSEKNEMKLVGRFKLNLVAMKKLMKLVFLNKFQIKNSFLGLANRFCHVLSKKHWVHLFLASQCHHMIGEQEVSEDVQFALQFKINLIKKNDDYQLKITLPSAHDLFSSEFYETNWDQYYVLKMLHSLLNEKDFIIDLNSTVGNINLGKYTIYKYKGLYPKFLKKLFTNSSYPIEYDGPSPSFTIDLNIQELAKKAPVDIKDFYLDSRGHFHFNLNFNDKAFQKIEKNKKVEI